jgi:hypothetical protein
MPPVEISGIVESAVANQFTKDPELIVSVICPDPYFTSLDGIVLTGQSVVPGSQPLIVQYNGTVEAGIRVKVTPIVNMPPNLTIQIGQPVISALYVIDPISSVTYFEMSSIPMQKYVQNIDINSGVITNLLSRTSIQEGSTWPMFQPGENEFLVLATNGPQDWELTYFERFGGL